MVDHNKKGGDAESQESVSGAASKVNLSRRTLAVIRMTTAEGNAVGVLPSECWRYLRVVTTKSNMSPPASSANTAWYEMVSVPLNNGNATYPSGDKVHAVKRVNFSPAKKIPLTTDDKVIRRAILDVVEKGKEIGGQSHPYSANATGANNRRPIRDDAMAAIKQAIPHHQWHPSDLEAVVSRSIKRMLKEGWLLDEEIKKGCFRGGSGLRVDWPRTLWPDKGDGLAGVEDDQDRAHEIAADSSGQLRNE